MSIPYNDLRRGFAAPLAMLITAIVVGCGGGGASETATASASGTSAAAEEDDPLAEARALIDRGERPPGMLTMSVAGVHKNEVPVGERPDQRGVFGPVFSLPILPIHQVLLPDGRVLFYGTDLQGDHVPGFQYAVWDPKLGTGSDAFLVLDKSTDTTLFCGGQSLLPDTGDVLLIGGSAVVDGVKNFGVSGVNRFDRAANSLSGQSSMASRRWYPTLLTLPDGQQLALGGRMTATTPTRVASTPEVWNKTAGWRSLASAASDDAYGATNRAWYYPRAWVNPAGDVYVLTPAGDQFRLRTTGGGTLSHYASSVPQAENNRVPAVLYKPGHVWAMRTADSTVSIDIGASPPVVSAVKSGRFRIYGNATLLADGQVWLNGGSPTGNVLANAWMQSETWNPATGRWTDGAAAAKPRLYHSASLLLVDGTVLTGGGGAPGPVTNLNAEIYYPPYLYRKDGSGLPAERPVIAEAPDVLGWNVTFSVTMSSDKPISRVTLVRTGAVTHNFNENQRFQELKLLRQDGSTLKLQTPASAQAAPPGYYLMFVFDADGVPSVAKVLRLG